MRPLNTSTIEERLRAAIDAGDEAQIMALGAQLDDLEAKRATPLILPSALWYASVGLHVFPLAPMSKIPHKGSKGFEDATTDEAQIRQWWAENPDSNVGIATGHLVDVVDIDGPPGVRSRLDNWAMFENLHIIAKVSTPRPGGMHLFVPAREGMGNKAHLLPGIDYRGLGGYVVAAPSVTPQGRYTFLMPLDPATLKAAA